MQRLGIKFKKMKVPYLFMIGTCMPIFLFIYFIPNNANTPLLHFFEKILDQDLFGKIGAWSSNFPLTSKFVTNYICTTAPVFGIIFTYKTIKHSTFERADYPKHSTQKLIFLLLGLIAFLIFVFFASYLHDTDLALARRRYAILGAYKITYALYSAGILCSLYILAVMSYLIFRYFPAYIIQKIRSTR